MKRSARICLKLLMPLLLTLLLCGAAFAAGLRIVPSAATVLPGNDFSFDVVAEGIPVQGLSAVQFKVNITSPDTGISGVEDLNLGDAGRVSLALPLLMSPATGTRSGVGDFFWNGKGIQGILAIDNQPLVNGSALYTFSHTSGAVPSAGSGTVARFVARVGTGVKPGQLSITASDILLLDIDSAYPLEYATGASVTIPCLTVVPNLTGMGLAQAQSALTAANLARGTLYKLNNINGTLPADVVLEQSLPADSRQVCQSAVNIALNTLPADVTQAVAVDKPGDNSGAVLLSWTPSVTPDAAGYRIYSGTTLLKEVTPASSSGTEIGGLKAGVATQLTIVVFDSYGMLSPGVTLSALALDDAHPVLSVVLAGTGSGSVSSSPGTDIACIKGSSTGCSTTVTYNSQVTLTSSPDSTTYATPLVLTATPDSATSTFAGWSTPCASVPCTINVTSNTTATATFNLAPRVKLDVTAAVGYDSLTAAYANSTDAIFVLRTLLQEEWTLAGGKRIVLKGGYQADYSTRSGHTILDGRLVIKTGSLRVSGLKLRSTVPLAPNLSLGYSGSDVVLTWTDATPANLPDPASETGFSVVRCSGECAAGDPGFQTIVTLPANTRTYTDTSAVNGAPYTYGVQAFNLNGSSLSNLVFIQPPTVTITIPTAGTKIPVSVLTYVTMSTTAKAGLTISKIELLVNGILTGSVTTSPYRIGFVAGLEGPYTLTARVTDNLGQVSTSAPVVVQAIRRAAMITPATSGDTLTGASQTFVWNDTGAEYYQIYVGTTGAGSSNLGRFPAVILPPATSVTVNNLPTNGGTIYVRLFSRINSVSPFTDYIYKAATLP